MYENIWFDIINNDGKRLVKMHNMARIFILKGKADTFTPGVWAFWLIHKLGSGGIQRYIRISVIYENHLGIPHHPELIVLGCGHNLRTQTPQANDCLLVALVSFRYQTLLSLIYQWPPHLLAKRRPTYLQSLLCPLSYGFLRGDSFSMTGYKRLNILRKRKGSVGPLFHWGLCHTQRR